MKAIPNQSSFLRYTDGMDSLTAPPGLLSIDEYLELEDGSSIKHEYVGGMVYALAGGSAHHNRIAINIVRKLADAADDTSCQVFMSDMKLVVENVAYYPDVMVVCVPPETENPTLQRAPCLLIEVLSPSTRRTDQGEKLMVYQTIPTLRAYLIVDQDFHRVERHYRGEDGVWHRADVVGDGSIPIPCPETELPLASIYRGLRAPPPARTTES